MTGVIHVITSLERGGAQRVALEIAARLHDPGRPQLLVTGRAGALDDEAQARLGTRLLRLPDLVAPVEPLKDIAAAISLVSLIDRQVERLGSPMIVHTHSSKAGVIGRLAARAVRGVVAVHTVHGFGLGADPRHGWALEAAERVAAVAGDVTVFVSDADQQRADELGLHIRRGVIIRAGVDPTPFVPLRRTRAGGGHLAVTVANLKAQKDPLFHVEILAAWRRLDPQARLVFLGDGPLRDEVVRRARALGVDDALELPGFVDDVRPFLAAADVCLLASAWEGLPCSVLEATAAGVPCVVRGAWAQELAWTRSVRALDNDASAAEFAHALVAMCAKAPRVAKLPRAFTREGMLAALSELYDELIGPPRPTGQLFARRRASRRAR